MQYEKPPGQQDEDFQTRENKLYLDEEDFRLPEAAESLPEDDWTSDEADGFELPPQSDDYPQEAAWLDNESDEGFSPDDIAKNDDDAAKTDVEAAMEQRQNWQDIEESTVTPETQDYPFDDPAATTASNPARWPMALAGLAVVAISLMAIGGYGVIDERAGLRLELEQLQGAMANAIGPEEAANLRQQAGRLAARNLELTAQMNTLQLENQGLADTITGLESQLETQLAAPAPAPAPVPEPAKPSPAEQKAQSLSAVAAGSRGNWFVNFSSYGQRSVAESWAARIQPLQGTVAITTAKSGDKTMYRVRVVGLEDKAQAEKVARKLEQDYKLPATWIGKQ
jgi:cell division septation protein DedD